VSGRGWGMARAAVTLAFFVAVAWLLRDELRTLDPHEIFAVLSDFSPVRIAMALLLTSLCYALVASYDRLASRQASVRLPCALGYAIAFVSYALNFNVGAMVGAVGFRYRLYSQAGVDAGRIGAILACSIVTNWSGCLTVLGAMLIADPSAIELGWDLPAATSRLLGLAALAPVAAYLIATRLRRAPIRVRGVSLAMPDTRFALAQIALASAYWLIVPLIIYVLRPPGATFGYSQVAVAYGLAAVAGIAIRLPAGLGVVEAVFLEIFRSQLGGAAILAMLIAWRAVFLVAPLAVAAIVLIVLELRGRPPLKSAVARR